MKRVLIIEDDPLVRDELEKILRKNHYEVGKITNFNSLTFHDQLEGYQLILLDINLPNQNGFDWCQQIRRHSKIPIIFVTSRDTEDDELKSIISGGDDFVTKPYSIPLLLEKMKRALINHNPLENKEMIVKGVTLDLHLSKIRYQNREAELTRNEFLILYYFFQNPNRDIDKEDILEYLWNDRNYLDENILTVNIKRIRTKLEEIGVYNFIQTSYRKGYRI